MRGTSRPTIASTPIASIAKIWGRAYDAKPSASAARASATTSSMLRPAVSPPKIPIFMPGS